MPNSITTPLDGPAEKSRLNLGTHLERYALIGVWVLAIAVFSVLLPGIFFTWTNFSILFASNAPGAILALALIIPLTAGDYDLSVGGTLTMSAVLVGVLNAIHGLPIGIVMPICLLAGLVIGLVNAFFIVYVRIPSLVVTLGMTSVLTGLVQWISNSSTIGGISPWLIDAVARSRLFGISYAFYYVLVIAALIWVLFEFTPLGRRMLFVGRGREVARLSGIDVGRVRVGALVASAMLASLAGLVYAGLLARQTRRPASTTCCLLSPRPILGRRPSFPGGSIPGARWWRSISLPPGSLGFRCSASRSGSPMCSMAAR